MKITREQFEQWLEKPQPPEPEPETKWQAIRPVVAVAALFAALTALAFTVGGGDPTTVISGWAGSQSVVLPMSCRPGFVD